MQSFVIAPAGTKSVWLALLILIAVLVPAMCILGMSLAGSRGVASTFQPKDCDCVAICTAASSRDELRGDLARRVDMVATPELQRGSTDDGHRLTGVSLRVDDPWHRDEPIHAD